LLGRLEYQRGHVEAALRVFDGIDISALVPKMKISIARKAERRKTHSQWDSPPMPLHAVSLHMEAIYLKARALHDLGKYKGMLHIAITVAPMNRLVNQGHTRECFALWYIVLGKKGLHFFCYA
jgi:hypothetical protein